jgi:hypothetical protein
MPAIKLIPGHKKSLYERWSATDPYDAFGREIIPGMIILKPPTSNYAPELLKVVDRKGDKIYVEGKRAKIALPGRCIIVTESIPEFVRMEVDE